jgi:NAD(P)-dependent dehydrogenase (short-subunit alcohol dehydrogenase family)
MSEVVAPPAAFDAAEQVLGPVAALVMSPCEAVASGLLDTTVESFDRHFAVNVRASWLLIREFATRFRGAYGDGRIVSLTSDSTSGNLPYGASKAALDRITLAATQELAHLGITANVINPDATDTGWMSEEQKQSSPDPSRSAGSASRRTARTSSRFSAPARVAGSTANCSTATAARHQSPSGAAWSTMLAGATHDEWVLVRWSPSGCGVADRGTVLGTEGP